MAFQKLDNETFYHNLSKLSLIVSKDEYYYQLLDVIAELYKEWDEEISFAEIRDQCIDMHGRKSDWSKTDWNQQTFRRLFIATKLKHLHDIKKDDEVLYWPSQEGLDFQIKLLNPLASGDQQSGIASKSKQKNTNKDFLKKFISKEALEQRGLSSSLVPDTAKEPDYPSIAQPAQPLFFNKFNKLLIRNDLLQEEDIFEGLIDYYDHVTFNLKDYKINDLILTKFVEDKSEKERDNNVYFQIYKNALNIYDTSAVTVSSGHFSVKDIGKNILNDSLSSNFRDEGTDYSILIYKKPGEINGPIYYELEGSPVKEEQSLELIDDSTLSKKRINF